MKISCLLVALMALTVCGCEEERDVEPNEIDVSFDKDLETFVNQVVSGGYSMGGAGRDGMKTIAEVANVKLLYANYKSSQKLQTAIEEFNRSSSALAKQMLYLTIVIAVLTVVIAVLTFVQVTNAQVSKPIWRFLIWIRKIVGSLAHSCMQGFAKTKKETKPTLEKYEGSNKPKESPEREN